MSNLFFFIEFHLIVAIASLNFIVIWHPNEHTVYIGMYKLFQTYWMILPGARNWLYLFLFVSCVILYVFFFSFWPRSKTYSQFLLGQHGTDNFMFIKRVVDYLLGARQLLNKYSIPLIPRDISLSRWTFSLVYILLLFLFAYRCLGS